MKTDVNRPKVPNEVVEGRANCAQCPIRSQTLFADLPDSALDQIRIAIDNVSYPAHTTLFKAGARDGALFSIRQGKIKLVRQLPNGTLRTVRLLRQGDTLGLEAMQNLPYRHSAIAVTEVRICRIPMAVIHTLKQQHPELERQLIMRMQQQLDTADQFITDFSTGTAEARVARLLLFLESTSTGVYCELLGREEMASILGITTETASRIMADFRRRGLVSGVINVSLSCDQTQLQQIALDM
ncbi:hypothetical protein CAP31_01105 [Sulfuriferula sp. AH1]|uniref:Crp/Fnr family transcriptional regulator n=1 Tax=Sulfuriferula sp. AH1 TaxID=1985873 RepID=UPI000B3B1CB5|nr:Crp/Fnr family transcriptional regulator [Sulfuriferula sp. AH1]ARU30412.1 hypothetical protein CAP31_01105 [Sulfuriferula sp. AH1]